MVRPGRERLHGLVEVDETYVGGAVAGGRRGRGAENKEIVVIALEVLRPKGFGRVRMRRVPDVSGDSLVPFICDVTEPGSGILTDGRGGYNSLTKHSYMHSKTVLSNSGDPAHIAMLARIIHKISTAALNSLLCRLFRNFPPQRTFSTPAVKNCSNCASRKGLFRLATTLYE